MEKLQKLVGRKIGKVEQEQWNWIFVKTVRGEKSKKRRDEFHFTPLSLWIFYRSRSFLQYRLFRRNRKQSIIFQVNSFSILVGCCHHDHCRIWWHEVSAINEQHKITNRHSKMGSVVKQRPLKGWAANDEVPTVFKQ